MSKAFTRESDDAPEPQPMARPVSALPPGTKNYVTPGGAQQMREELESLLTQRLGQTAAATGNPNLISTRRIAQLQQSLATAVITPPPAPPWDQVRFGATVTVRDRIGETTSYRIVGVDEVDLDRDWVSWLSPIARALLNARLGEHVRFKFPAGETELEIIGVTYE